MRHNLMAAPIKEFPTPMPVISITNQRTSDAQLDDQLAGWMMLASLKGCEILQLKQVSPDV